MLCCTAFLSVVEIGTAETNRSMNISAKRCDSKQSQLQLLAAQKLATAQPFGPIRQCNTCPWCCTTLMSMSPCHCCACAGIWQDSALQGTRCQEPGNPAICHLPCLAQGMHAVATCKSLMALFNIAHNSFGECAVPTICLSRVCAKPLNCQNADL